MNDKKWLELVDWVNKDKCEKSGETRTNCWCNDCWETCQEVKATGVALGMVEDE